MINCAPFGWPAVDGNGDGQRCVVCIHIIHYYYTFLKTLNFAELYHATPQTYPQPLRRHSSRITSLPLPPEQSLSPLSLSHPARVHITTAYYNITVSAERAPILNNNWIIVSPGVSQKCPVPGHVVKILYSLDAGRRSNEPFIVILLAKINSTMKVGARAPWPGVRCHVINYT